MISSIEESLNSNDAIREAVVKLLSSLGRENGAQMARDCFDHAICEVSSAGRIMDIFLSKCRPVVIAFINGAASSSSNHTLHKELVPPAISIFVAGTCACQMKSKITQMIEHVVTLLKSKVDQSLAFVESEETEDTLNQDVDVLVAEWREKICEIVNQLIERRIIDPLLTTATAYVQEQVEGIVLKEYDDAMASEDVNNASLELCRDEFEKENSTTEMAEAKARAECEAKFTDLAETTRSPRLMARLIDNGIQIDERAACATATLLSERFQQSFEVRIQTVDRRTITYCSVNESAENSDVTVIEVNLNDKRSNPRLDESKNFMELVNETCFPQLSSNPRLYEALRREDPRVTQEFPTDASFRVALADIISTDSNFRVHVQEDWHSISVQRRLIGELDDQSLCNSLHNFSNSAPMPASADFDTLRQEMQRYARAPGVELTDTEMNALLRGSVLHYEQLRRRLLENTRSKFPLDGRLRVHYEVIKNSEAMLKVVTQIPNFLFDKRTFMNDSFNHKSTDRELQQQLCSAIVASIMKCIQKKGENAADALVRFAVFTLCGEKNCASTIFITSNFYASKNGKSMPPQLIDIIKKDHGKKLAEVGIKTFAFVTRNTQGLAETIAAKRNRPVAAEDHQAVEHYVPAEILAHYVALEQSSTIHALAVSRARCRACPEHDAATPTSSSTRLDSDEEQALIKNVKLHYAKFQSE